jgi:DNA-binding transcriptional LysR family regulator
MLVILPPTHSLVRRRVVSVQDLRGIPLVLREPGSTTRRLIERAFLTCGLTAEPAMELESNEAIKSAVADGIGVAIMAYAAVAQDLTSGRLAGRRLREPLSLDFALVYHRDRVLSPLLAAFLEVVPKPRRAGPARPGKEFARAAGSIRPV